MTPAQRILEHLAREPASRLALPHVGGALRALIAADLVLKKKQVLLIGRSQADAETLYRDLAFFFGATEEEAPEKGLLYLGADEQSPYEEHTPDHREVMNRLDTLYRLAKTPHSVRAVVVSPLALTRRHVPPEIFKRGGDYLLRGTEIDRQGLLGRLARGGYNPVSVVEDPGTFSVRGGIIDIWSPNRFRPARIDLFGDEIESIRLFDPISQRNLEDVEELVVLPAREIVYNDAIVAHASKALEQLAERMLIPSRRLHTTLEDLENQIFFFGVEALLPAFHPEGLVTADRYLPKDAVCLFGGEDELERGALDTWTEAQLGFDRAKDAHHLAYPPEQHLADSKEVMQKLLQQSLVLQTPEIVLGNLPTLEIRHQTTEEIRGEILRATRNKTEGDDVLHPLVHRLRSWRGEGYTNVIVCQTRGQAERLRELLAPKSINAKLMKEPFVLQDYLGDGKKGSRDQLRDRTVHVHLALGELSSGFVLPGAQLSLVSEEEIFGQRTKRKKKKTVATESISDLKDLKPGDFVVHVDYGIGLYKGMTKLSTNGVDSDYLHIEYKAGDKLYLPAHRLRLISKFASSEEGRSPNLDKLGGTSWATTKKKVKDTLFKMASELLRLYAVRTTLEGFALKGPDETFRQFEAEFAFEPTPDQQKAILDVVADLQKASPADRLICGDVGYGKTEVAMRAAMLAVLNQKQVAVLVPTTVLAAQHFQVFKERFSSFPVRIGMISRFQSAAEVKETLKQAKEGAADIVIGTHALIGKEVQFKDLGLLVIDEEHRFGVSHKEKLKKYRAQVHVISMSATPIPRTLHLGFMGVRDLSVIATPPPDRLAVKTEVHKFGEEVIREAIVRELRRGGQCFVVHNRVASIGAFARFLERLVPEARIGIGHGQMAEDQLEQVMVDFMEKKYNVLLSTTIIESGIDITNANTMIINRADAMGLAQLYQLRGRVGRGKSRGFAYFLIPPGNLSKKAKARIAVLQRFTELGAGFQVASKDLEIRGAGNVLGKQQSGSIAAVGFDMYQALLQEAIEELKGSHRRSLKEPEVTTPVPAFIPDSFVAAPSERLSYYQRFNNAETDEELYDVLQTLTELYGNPPAEVENLAQLMLVKARLYRVGALGLEYGAQTKVMPPRIVVRFDPEQNLLTPEALVRYVAKDGNTRKLTPEGKLVLYLKPFDDLREIFSQAKDQLEALIRLKRPEA